MPNSSVYRENLTEDFSMALKTSLEAEKKHLHIHRDFELLYVLSPNVNCRLDEEVLALENHTLLLFNNMDLHRVYPAVNGPPYRRYVVYFKPEFIQGFSSPLTNLLDCFYFRPFNQPQLLPVPEADRQELLQRLTALDQAFSSTAEDVFGSDLEVKFLFGELLVFINRLYQKHHKTALLGGEKFRRVYEVIQFIHDHYAENITLDVLSARFFINKSYLCVVFKQATGISPAQYIINCRLMRAKHLLAAQMPVEEVCDMVGYNNLSHFSRLFKAHTGVSPKRYQLASHQ